MVHMCAYFVEGISVLEMPICSNWFISLVHGCVSGSRVGFLLPTVIS